MLPVQIAWLALAGTLAVAALRRPAWGMALYLLTFFANPAFWWWGGQLAGARWNLGAGLVLVLALAVDTSRGTRVADRVAALVGDRWSLAALVLLVLILLNALAVHRFLAPVASESWPRTLHLVKHAGLGVVVLLAVRGRRDVCLVRGALLLGLVYLGVEALLHRQGRLIDGRLEELGPTGANESNHLAALVLVLLPLAAAAWRSGRRWERLLAVAALPFGVQLLVLARSRGATLAALAMGVAFVVAVSRGAERRFAARCTALTLLVALIPALRAPRPAAEPSREAREAVGGVAAIAAAEPRAEAVGIASADGPAAGPLEGPGPDPVEPVGGSEDDPGADPAVDPAPSSARATGELDADVPPEDEGPDLTLRFVELADEISDPASSAGNRLRIWKVVWALCLAHPAGSGGDAALSTRGQAFAAAAGAEPGRTAHNGFLEEAAAWGFQGLALRLAFLALLLGVAWRRARSGSCDAIEGAAEVASLVALLAGCLSMGRLGVEWQYWLAGLVFAGPGPGSGPDGDPESP